MRDPERNFRLRPQLHGNHFYQITGFSLIILEYTVVCTLSLLDTFMYLYTSTIRYIDTISILNILHHIQLHKLIRILFVKTPSCLFVHHLSNRVTRHISFFFRTSGHFHMTRVYILITITLSAQHLPASNQTAFFSRCLCITFH